MTLKELQEKFPIGSMVMSKKDRWGIILSRYEAIMNPSASMAMVAWYSDITKGLTHIEKVHIDTLEPVGEYEAVETLINFAGRLLQDSPATIGRSEEEELKEAIDTCEGAFGL